MGPDITTLGALSIQLKEKYPNLVVNAYRWDGITSGVSKGDKHFREPIQLGDSTLFEMFGFKLLHGDVRTALNEPYSVVITPEKAIKYFGRTDVVGESLTIQSFSGQKRDFKITGVFDKGPENSVTHSMKTQITISLFLRTPSLISAARILIFGQILLSPLILS